MGSHCIKSRGDRLRDGMDMALCVIDKTSKTLQFAGAMNSIFYIQDDLSEIKEIENRLEVCKAKNQEYSQ